MTRQELSKWQLGRFANQSRQTGDSPGAAVTNSVRRNEAKRKKTFPLPGLSWSLT
jgi:hypothetical protein